MEADETMILYDVTSHFICFPVTEAVDIVLKDYRITISTNRVYLLLELSSFHPFHKQGSALLRKPKGTTL